MALGTRKVGVERSGFELVAMVAKKKYSGEDDKGGSGFFKASRFNKGQIEGGNEPKCGIASVVGGDRWFAKWAAILKEKVACVEGDLGPIEKEGTTISKAHLNNDLQLIEGRPSKGYRGRWRNSPKEPQFISLCVNALLSPRRKLGSCHARSLPLPSSFEKVLNYLAGSDIENKEVGLQGRILSLKAEAFLEGLKSEMVFNTVGVNSKYRLLLPFPWLKFGFWRGLLIYLLPFPLVVSLRVNKFPSGSFGVVSYPIGVVSPVVKPSQELEGDSFLMLSQNRPDKSSFPEKIKCHFRRISDYRPIILVTGLYKIIAKVLSRHLRKVLQDTIFSTQGAFVEGRQILDVVLIANELVDEKRRSREEGVIFKIDLEKAYGHVDWDFFGSCT
ncbi:hypothetical protein CK203_019092 [Vitis vinifera]|uniref:Reverse transcriptase domain-containing protein n=1 Tax=Vitis vinifera TaxID=29760 RepID=A0A438IR44_VITVI|nr:hypothetical protein CK203_019092 [Vitis vinifera]